MTSAMLEAAGLKDDAKVVKISRQKTKPRLIK